MFRSRTALHSLALWLALSAVVLRSLIPVGFMPGWTGSGTEAGNRWLIICPASPLSAALMSPATAQGGHHAGHHDHAAMMAAMAASANVAAPHAGHAGMQHGIETAAADPHAGHDAAQHNGHRLASEHQSCPFAGAVAPALPAVAASFAARAPVATLGRPDAVAAVATATQRRLPPARAPPAIDDHAVA